MCFLLTFFVFLLYNYYKCALDKIARHVIEPQTERLHGHTQSSRPGAPGAAGAQSRVSVSVFGLTRASFPTVRMEV